MHAESVFSDFVVYKAEGRTSFFTGQAMDNTPPWEPFVVSIVNKGSTTLVKNNLCVSTV